MPAMMRRGGIVINITSVSGLTGMPRQVNYSASKAGVTGLTKALAKEVARFGMRVNAVGSRFYRNRHD
jgi:3-oxoacyl-[acyl-carrier protein] reductase